MTIRELYEWAEKLDILDINVFKYRWSPNRSHT